MAGWHVLDGGVDAAARTALRPSPALWSARTPPGPAIAQTVATIADGMSSAVAVFGPILVNL